ncbi:TPA: HeH/LEM domain-containing protein [Streptococcus suis]
MELIKVEVTEEFFDKVAQLDRAVGDVFEVDAERLEVLSGANSEKRAFVKVLEESDSETDYSKLKTDEIKELLTEKGIEFDKAAKKSDLIALLTAAE